MNVYKYAALFSIAISQSMLLVAAEDSASEAVVVDPYANPPSPVFAQQTQAPEPAQKSNFNVQVLMTDLQSPRSLVSLPDGRMLVAEGTGVIRIIDTDGTISAPLNGMPEVRSVNGRGFNDFILDANFSTNRRVYLSYQSPQAGAAANQVATAFLSEDFSQLEQVSVIAELIGRRLVSSPDGTLFITTAGYGDAGRPKVQDMTSLLGKIIRINNDGSIPKDNPYYGNANVRQEIFEIGHRDPDGAVIHPTSGELWTIEHGPMGGDELNLIKAGGNSGWPKVTYGKNYDGTEIAPSTGADTSQPRYYWFPSVAPSGLMTYTGDLFPQWQGNFFLGTMSPTQGKFIARLIMEGDTVVAEEHLLVDHDRRVRAITQGADGAMYVLTDSESNDETNRHFPGEVLRLMP